MFPIARIAATLLGTALSISPALAQPVSQEALQTTLSERIERYKKGVGIAAFVVTEKGVEFSQHGSLRADARVPVTPDTLFEIGSITKTFTGLLLAELSLRGVVKLDDPAEKYFPDGVQLRDHADAPIRLVDLATHRSGLPRLQANFNPPDPTNPYAAMTDKSLLGDLKALQVDRAARAIAPKRDEKHAYSNFGYAVLGYALGRADGADYETSLRKRILEPLGMKAAFLAVPANEISKFSDGHDKDMKKVPHWDFPGAVGAAGALRMSARDLARYAQAAVGITETPLAPAFALAMKVHGEGPTKANPVGLAWLHAPLNGRQLLNHDGGTYGFSSTLWLDPTRKIAAGAIANAFVEVKDLGLHALESTVPTTNFALTEQKNVALKPDALKAIEGVYALSPEMNVTVRVDGERAFAQATGQGEFEIFAKDALQFFAKVTPLEMRFEPSVEGRAPAFTLIQRGRETVAKRTNVSTKTIDPQTLKPLVGVFHLGPQFDVTIRADGARLFAQATGQGEFELFAQNDLVFIAKVAPIELRFAKPENGVSNGFVLMQGGNATTATRIAK